MATGLLALLDDVAALVKASAASLDDISVQVAKTGAKVSGVVIDDAAVTPKYVVGLDPKREVAIVYSIARSSLFNKLVYLAPAALLLGWLAPWAIQPLLMIGGAYLCFEGYEKVHSIFAGHGQEAAKDENIETITPAQLEKIRISSAVRTDFILSAEIVAISYSMVAQQSLASQIAVLAAVAAGITIAVYGFVALVVKADDFGVWLAQSGNAILRSTGRGIVHAMPGFLKGLGYIGTVAMLWVGAGIIAHGVPLLEHGLEALTHVFDAVPALGWSAQVLVLALAGLVLGGVIAKAVALAETALGKRAAAH
ncbi:MAG: DUF808 domain-containing protein [Beijerinckiaceae bacterium]